MSPLCPLPRSRIGNDRKGPLPGALALFFRSVAVFCLAGTVGCPSGSGTSGVADGPGPCGPGSDIHGDFEAAVLDCPLDRPLTKVDVSDILVVQNPGNVLSCFVEWKTSVKALSELTVSCADDIVYTLSGQSAATEHRAFVMGLYVGAECNLEVVARTPDGAVGNATTSLAVGQVPDFLPPLTVLDSQPSKVQPGWTLFNLTNSYAKLPLVVAIFDENGRYRWYHRRAVTDTGADTDTRTLPEGILVGGTHGHVLPALIDWQGNVVWERKIFMHHDLRPFGDQGLLLYLTDTWACGLEHPSGAVVAWDPLPDKKLWKWNLCDHFLPKSIDSDWSHLNAAALPPDDSYMLVSSRNQDAIFKVSLPDGKVLWKLGGQSGGDFIVAPEDSFLRQHDPEIQPDGSILLFDNGLAEKREYSRALQLALDETSMTVTRVFEYRHDPDIFSPVWGDADRLPNGNTLILFGQRDQKRQTRFIEVTPEGQKVSDIALPPSWGAYRAERFTELRYGYMQ